jgi:OOP family OmpA-OmpF porin
MKYSLTFLLAITCLIVNAQTIQWASKVVKVSSQRSTTKGGAANQALGKPNCFPQNEAGQSRAVWKPSLKTAQEFIQVSFDFPMKIKQVMVAENKRPGALVAIMAYDSLNNEFELKTFMPQFTALRKRIFSVILPETSFKVHSLKLVFNHAGAFADSVEIDAIGISNTEDLPLIKTNDVPGLENMAKPENLGENVNSKFIELLPVIAPDGKTLYYSRRDHPGNIEGPKDDIWFSTLGEDGKWKLAQNIGRPLNNATYNYLSAISPDGNTLLIDDQLPAMGRPINGLSFVRMTPMGWSYPEKLLIENYYNKNIFNEFNLANDGKTLLMSVERNDTYGVMDMYVTFRKADGKWTIPKNLGPQVNTACDDQYPFLAADGVTLYFVSDGYSAYGSDDIYMTKRLDDTWQNWSEPQNLGPTINTISSDLSFTLPASGDYAYLVSGHEAIGASDIFRVKLPEALKPKPVVLIKGIVLDAKTGKPIVANVKYETLADGKEVGIANADPKTGNYKIVLPCGANYAFLASAPGYMAEEQNLDLGNCSTYAEIQKDLVLVPIEVGQKIRLNNLFFDSKKFDLKPFSSSELTRIVAFLKNNATVKIEIAGHTDNVGKEPDNQLLSQNRAKAVADYLLAQGIDMVRIQYKGYGSLQSVLKNDTETNRALNRRVEMKILSK